MRLELITLVIHLSLTYFNYLTMIKSEPDQSKSLPTDSAVKDSISLCMSVLNSVSSTRHQLDDKFNLLTTHLNLIQTTTKELLSQLEQRASTVYSLKSDNSQEIKAF